ncbi:hypothetical protein DQQ10_13305 [Pseudochryseolinea flava]|uniref:Phosphatase n=2 Tax=Pseudochryseolinea flava TaxID=2059302 RepID=A0A364Y156_9BACT|nr:hypothetical protein DQQ10_13305 [Pseudochryseolinea flava]
MSLLVVALFAFTSCEGPEGDVGPQGEKGDKGDQGDPAPGPPNAINLKAHSITPALLKKLAGFENVEVFPLISSEDQLIETPNFIFGGSADGAGLLQTSLGYSLLVNHEDNFSVSRITLDKSFKPVAGEYLLNSSGGLWRLCSATLATPAEHGFGPVYFTCGESNIDSQTHGLNPLASSSGAGFSKALPALGRWNAENAVPLPKTAYPGKTAIVIGDDESDAGGGQLALYLANTVGDLTNGKVYVLRRVDQNQREMDIETGEQIDVEFMEIAGASALSGAQMNTEANSLKAIAFGRVEDIDYRKGGGANGREVYFNVTGQNNTGVNADYSRSKYGRTYKLVLSETSPLTGKLELILDGDDREGVAKAFQNPDNIMVTTNYAYIQEDPNSGYNDQQHDSRIYQYNLATKELKNVFEVDPRRNEADADKFNAVSGGAYPEPVKGKAGYGAWEYGAMIDISDIIGSENTFLLNVQPHTWQSDYFRNPDGGSIRVNEKQGSQVLIIKGLPR